LNKKRIVKDYEKLPEEVVERVKLTYPHGFVDHLISYSNKEGMQVSALPFETEDIYYLIRMTISEARQIIEDDDDYDDDGNLREDFADDSEDIPEDMRPEEEAEEESDFPDDKDE
jgi:DNA-directed RNA polymerase subunit delta